MAGIKKKFLFEAVIVSIAFLIVLAFNFFPTNHILTILFIFVAIPFFGFAVITCSWKLLKEGIKR